MKLRQSKRDAIGSVGAGSGSASAPKERTSVSAHATDVQRLRDAGLRPTTPRLSILEVLRQSGHGMPCDVADIFRRLISTSAEVGQGTVYRVLRELEQANIVQREWHTGLQGLKSVYRFVSEGEPAAGPYLVCRNCSRTVSLDDAELAWKLEQFANQHGMRTAGAALTIVAECLACGEKKPDKGRAAARQQGTGTEKAPSLP